MQKVNLGAALPERVRKSPTGKYNSHRTDVSLQLGREADSTDLLKRHPFDLMVVRIPPGASLCPYHMHSAQWEMYIILSGTGQVRDEQGLHEVGAGDVFIYKPGEAHQISNGGDVELVYHTIADNPVGDTCYYPDSGKWNIPIPKDRTIITGREVDYYEGEE